MPPRKSRSKEDPTFVRDTADLVHEMTARIQDEWSFDVRAERLTEDPIFTLMSNMIDGARRDLTWIATHEWERGVGYYASGKRGGVKIVSAIRSHRWVWSEGRYAENPDDGFSFNEVCGYLETSADLVREELYRNIPDHILAALEYWGNKDWCEEKGLSWLSDVTVVVVNDFASRVARAGLCGAEGGSRLMKATHLSASRARKNSTRQSSAA